MRPLHQSHFHTLPHDLFEQLQSAAIPSARLPLRRSRCSPPDPPAVSTARAERPPGSASPVPARGVVAASPPAAESSFPGLARSAAGSCRIRWQNRAHSTRCDILPPSAPLAHTAASRRNGPANDLTPAQKTSSTLAGFARTNLPRNCLATLPQNVGTAH